MRSIDLASISRLGIILIFAVLIGQGIKSIVKNYTSEPRPYVTQLEKSLPVDSGKFYVVTDSERAQMIDQYVQKTAEIPSWLESHWQAETGYSFPSGHTLFASSWVFLVVLFIGFKRHSVITTAVVGWGVVVETSRLALGMHYPADLIASNIFGCFIALLAYFCAKRWRIID
ncbi:phosphatase PAP2 family protein [Utexia brackfieldae]|uniref:phosphatase PAP2 family protein n=1 Tax=Utexia brackfieldae TaxID=3074108 RepID=UPI00370D6A5E